MTGPYEWRPMPHRLDVVCPHCAQCAEFEFAEVVRIQRRADIDYFRDSKLFEYQEFQDSCGHNWHAAVYFQGLHGTPPRALQGLPEGYAAKDWEHSRYFSHRRGWPVGSIRCGNCAARGRHVLAWPEDAYFSIAYRGHVLWAFHRESAFDLLQYLQSTERDRSRYRWGGFLLYVPTVFKVRKARDAVVRQLAKRLGLAIPANQGHRRT